MLNRLIPKLLTILVAVGCTACVQSRETSFFKSFSLQKLIEQNKSSVGLNCDAGGGGEVSGGGGGVGTGTWSWPRKSTEFHSRKGDGFSCRLRPDAVDSFDQTALITGLRQVVAAAIAGSGAKVIDSGNRNSRSFYFTYALDNIKGRVEITAKTIIDGQVSLNADLEESGTTN